MFFEYMQFKKSKIRLGKQIYLTQKNTSNHIERTIEIAFATDENYVQHCAASIASILLNCDNTSIIRFHILHSKLSSISIRKIEELKKIRDFEIIYYDMDKYDFSKFPMNRKYISKATYYRILLPKLLDEKIKKIIYLDCDIIVEQDLKELWETDISQYYAGVVEDEGSYEQQLRMGMPLNSNYFNAGVIVFNIEKLRQIDFETTCTEYFNNNQHKIIFQDQDILNGVFCNSCKFLPLKWNTNNRIYCGNNLLKHYTSHEALIAGYNPGILHYTDKNKPWNVNCENPLKSEYWLYLKYTEFYKDTRSLRFIIFIKDCINHIFSLKKHGNFYLINILGIKIKILSKTLEQRNKLKHIDLQLSILSISINEIKTLLENKE